MAVANPEDSALTDQAKEALMNMGVALAKANPLKSAEIFGIGLKIPGLVEKLPEEDRKKLVVAINADPAAASNAIKELMTSGQDVFDPKKAATAESDFAGFSRALLGKIAPAQPAAAATADTALSPVLPSAQDVSSQIEKKMHAQFDAAFDKGLVNVGRTSAPLTAEEGAWFDEKMKDPAFAAQVRKEALAGFHVDEKAGTYDQAAFEKFIENPERFSYEAAKRAEQNQPAVNPTQDFSTAAADPNKSVALTTFEKKLGEADPERKKQYDAFAASHPEFRGRLAQMFEDVPELPGVALKNTALLKIAMEDSDLAAKGVHKYKDMIRGNIGRLESATAGDMRLALGMPTPPGEAADLSSGGMMMKFVQIIGQLLVKMFPSLGPYVEEFTGMTGKIMEANDALKGITDPGTQTSGDPDLNADAKTAAAGTKPEETAPETKQDPALVAAAETRKRAAVFGNPAV
jgi:hypothetical protein